MKKPRQQNTEEKVIFSLAPMEDGGPPMLMLLMTKASWEYMRDGMAHEFDLTNLGLPIRLVLTGTATRASGMEMVRKLNAAIETRDLTNIDVRFGQDKKPQ